MQLQWNNILRLIDRREMRMSLTTFLVVVAIVAASWILGYTVGFIKGARAVIADLNVQAEDWSRKQKVADLYPQNNRKDHRD